MQQAQQQQQPQSSQMMLPPRPPPQPQVRSVSQLQTPIPQVGQLHQIQQIQNMARYLKKYEHLIFQQNVINSQIVGAEVSTLPLAQQSVQQVQQQIQSWPTSQNVLMNTVSITKYIRNQRILVTTKYFEHFYRNTNIKFAQGR